MISDRKYISMLRVVLILCASVLLSCITDYNPFEDLNNAQVVINSQTFDNLDTLEIFSTETLTITITNISLIDSVKVRATANRKFIDDEWCVRAIDNTLGHGPYDLLFSFYKTGPQIIEICTYRKNGDNIKKILKCDLISPLKPQAVKGNFGEEVNLKTTGVKDDNVIYEWDFNGMYVTSVLADARIKVNNTEYKGTGLLRVLDHKYKSDAVKFSYEFGDLLAPEIIPEQITYVLSGDTIRTSEKNFYFTVRIKDQGGNRIDSASINGVRFDKVNGDIYTKVINRLDSLKTLTLNLYASDNYMFRNVTTAKYYLVYDASVKTGSGVKISVLSPTDDTSYYSLEIKDIFAKLDVYTDIDESINVIVKGNNIDTAIMQENLYVGKALLNYGLNKVDVMAVSQSNRVLASVSKIIVFDTTEIIDEEEPVILEIRADGKVVESRDYTSTKTVVNLEIVAFDEGSGIQQLLINNKEQTIEKGKYLWTYRVSLGHTAAGDTVTVLIRDRKGLETSRTIILYYNNKPYLEKHVIPPRLLAIGDTYRDTLKMSDADGDSLRYSVVAGQKMTINSNGVFSYTPDSDDEGVQHFTIKVDDGFERESYIFEFDIRVVRQIPERVRFGINSFPQYLLFGIETEVPLKIEPSTGLQPLSFIAINTETGKKYSTDSTKNTITLNCVDSSEIGALPCMIIVQDSALTSDTLFHVFHVVTEQAAGLEMVGKPAYYKDNILDIRNPVQLDFKINSFNSTPDKQYSVFVKQYGKISSEPVFAFTEIFSLPLKDKDSVGGYDTIVVSAINTETVVSCTFVAYYGYAHQRIVLSEPQDKEIITDSSITFLWKQLQNVTAQYELAYGIYPVLDKKINLDTCISLQKILRSGLYGWKVTASDGTNRFESDIRTFKLENPGHIHFNRELIQIGNEFVAGDDSLNTALPVINRTVHDSAYSCWLGETPLQVNGGVLKYSFQKADTGWQRLVLTVTDEAANSDTISKMIRIYPSATFEFRLKDESRYIRTDSNAIDLSHSLQPDTLVFQLGMTPDSIVVKLGNSEYVVKNDGNNEITVIINPAKTSKSYEKLEITIKKDGQSKQYSELIYYGTPPVFKNLWPDSAAFVENELDTIRWSFDDIDGDSLSYTICFGNDKDKMDTLDNLSGVTEYVFSVPKTPGIYYWKVIASDGRFTSESPVYPVLVNTYAVYVNTKAAGIKSTITNVPVLLRLNSTNVIPSRLEFVFRKSKDISTILPFEIDHNNDERKEIGIWVLVDTLLPNDSTQFFYMQVGGDTDSESNGKLVFNTENGFQGVWHLQEESGSSIFKDVTKNGYHGDNKVGSLNRSGVIARGQEFQGSSDHISIPACSNLGATTNSIACEAWVKCGSLTEEGGVFSLSCNPVNEWPKYELLIDEFGAVKLLTRDSGIRVETLSSTIKINDDEWHHIAGIVDKRNKLIIYIDGLEDVSKNVAPLNLGNEETDAAIIGANYKKLNYFKGSIDEVRVSHGSRSADWFKFSYTNQHPTSTIVKVVKNIQE